MNGDFARVVVDWAKVRDLASLYDTLFEQTGAPSWHGRNLNAINDAWVTGSICNDGPPFNFVFLNEDQLSRELKDAAKAIRQIAEESVTENGGSVES